MWIDLKKKFFLTTTKTVNAVSIVQINCDDDVNRVSIAPGNCYDDVNAVSIAPRNL